MRYVVLSSHERTGFAQKLAVKLGILSVGVGCFLTPMSASAGSVITHEKFLEWIASVTGAAQNLGPNASSSELVGWAQSQGLAPAGGWKLGATLKKEELALTLVQLLKLNPKKYNGDLTKNLLREGIVLPDDEEVTRESLVSTFDNFAFVGQTYALSMSNGTPTNGGNGQPGVPPPPGFRNPNNPHFGQEPNNVPGHVGIGRGANNGDKGGGINQP